MKDDDWGFDTGTSKVHIEPNGKMERVGIKFDQDKLQFELIPPEVELWLAEVLTHGAKKYAPDNWKKIETKRYLGALRRHLNQWQRGETMDSESKLHHLKHALTNMAFICWLEIEGNKQTEGV